MATINDFTWKAYGIPKPECEYKFHKTRRWRFDYAWPEFMIALEKEGGSWIQGRHTRGKGFIADIEKYNAAVVLGWRLLRCIPNQIDDGSIFDNIKEIISQEDNRRA